MASQSGTRHRGWWIAFGIIAVLLLLVVTAAFFAEEPLRRYAEAQANQRLPEYHTTIGALELHPLTLAADLKDIVIRQQAHPEPALAVIPYARAGIAFLPLFTGTVSADLHVDRLALSATREQVDTALKKGAHQESKEQAVAWQDTLREMLPLRLALAITNSDVTYVGAPAAEPIYVQFEIAADNVTNRPKPDQTHPAALRIKANFLDQARLTIDGHADPLAKPHAAVVADMNIENLDIPTALSMAGKNELPVKAGVVGVRGHVDYAPSQQAVTIEEIAVVKPVIDYVGGTASGRQTAQAKDAAAAAAPAIPAWQDRVTELFPITIHRVAVQDGEVTYRPNPKADAVRVSRLDVTVSEIRNHSAATNELPSEVRVSAQLPEDARLTVEGRANVVAKPLPAVDATMTVERLRLQSLLPVAEPFHVYLRDGVLDMKSRLRQTKDRTMIAVEDFLLDHAKLDYVHTVAGKGKDAQRAKKGAGQAKQANQDPSLLVKVQRGKILHSEVGFVNETASPDYRVFMADMNVDMENLSNRVSEGTGAIKMTGKFMGSGPTVVSGTFRPEKPTPDFDVDIRIIKTKLTSLNNVFRAHGNLDMHEGMFAFFSELKVKDGKVDGYVRPFLKDVDVYDPAQDRNKSTLNKAYQAIVGGVTALFQNQPRNEVATDTDVSGPVENPQAHTWQMLGNLVQNAFFEAISPGLKG
ncbi:MAG: DUF748 domain-containing protein [Nitrospiraceae bacterium]|nr:DUF748 domain-containing protein [Nitrospiraceae bacterium]